MNCKPGDLAYIKSTKHRFDNGKIVEVLKRSHKGDKFSDGRELNPLDPNAASWWVKGTDLHALTRGGSIYGGYSQISVLDSSLRPIRDPGDDATDETLLWLPVPSRETESA